MAWLYPEAVSNPEESSWINVSNNLSFEAMLVGFALTLQFPRFELAFLVAKASLCYLMALATVWQTFEAPMVRIFGSVLMFLALWRVLPEEPDFLSQLDD